MNVKFTRSFGQPLIESLRNQPLFIKKLQRDIEQGTVFPAIRKDQIGFYHKGGRLFLYDGKGKEFKTNAKYAVGAYLNLKGDVGIGDLKDIKVEDEFFVKGYERIKENCSLYAGEEADGVSQVYSKYSYATCKSDIVVLDIEATFSSSERKTDKIDLLLYDNKKKRLKFYEAKHFSNSEIWGTEPKVINQIKRYEKQIKVSEDNIVKAYVDYINTVNKLFGLDLNKPKGIDTDVALLIFGFDNDQLKGSLDNQIKKLRDKGVKTYKIGGIKGLKIKTLWES